MMLHANINNNTVHICLDTDKKEIKEKIIYNKSPDILINDSSPIYNQYDFDNAKIKNTNGDLIPVHLTEQERETLRMFYNND